MIRKLAIAFVAAVILLALSPLIDAQAVDYLIAQNRVPVCNPAGSTPNLYYDAAGGHWHCTASDAPWQDAAPGTALSYRTVVKEVSGLTDATFTDMYTVTVPNGAHSATIPIVLNGRLGAGGAIGADECTATAYGQVVVARTAGLATVATATTLSNTGSSCVAGATTITLAYQVSAITGGNSGTQTFTIQVKVTKGAGSSANHKVDARAELLNSNGSGITIS